MITRLAGRVGRTVRSIVVGPTMAERALLERGRVAELVARQFGEGGYRRLDLFVAYAAIAEAAGGEPGGLALLDKLLRADPLRRKTDSALLALLRHGPLTSSRFVPAPAVIDPDLRLLSNIAGLAAALYYGEAEVAVSVWKRQPAPPYDAAWFRAHGFSAAEVERIDSARAEAYARLGLAPLPWSDVSRIQHELARHLDPRDPLHGMGGFYQSCEDLCIRGQRSTTLRFDAYRLEAVLNSDQRVLDIGCNCGFLALNCARYVKQVDGFDINPRFIAIAQAAQRHLGRQNCNFAASSFDAFVGTPPYDVIFSFAVHHWIGEPIAAYAGRLQRLLRPGGIVLLESQSLSSHDQDWATKLDAFCGVGFEPLRSGTLCDDGVRARQHVLLRDTRAAASGDASVRGAPAARVSKSFDTRVPHFL